jgi:hypothetical protein
MGISFPQNSVACSDQTIEVTELQALKVRVCPHITGVEANQALSGQDIIIKSLLSTMPFP